MNTQTAPNIETHPGPLAAKVAARNRANTLMLELAPKILAIMAGWAGRHVLNDDGTISKKLKNALPALPHDTSTKVFLKGDKYSLSLEITCTEHYERGSMFMGCHQKAWVYLTDVEGGNLKKCHDFQPQLFRTDFTVEGVEDARIKLQLKKAELKQAERALEEFGENDLLSPCVTLDTPNRSETGGPLLAPSVLRSGSRPGTS